MVTLRVVYGLEAAANDVVRVRPGQADRQLAYEVHRVRHVIGPWPGCGQRPAMRRAPPGYGLDSVTRAA